MTQAANPSVDIYSALLLAAVLIATGSGCGNSDSRDLYHVQGTVTYQGQPVSTGSIIFQPDPSQGNQGPYGSAQIENGKFDTQKDGQATVGGPHLVMIEAFDGVNPDPDFAPYGKSLGGGYQESFDLPKQDTKLDIELTDRRR